MYVNTVISYLGAWKKIQQHYFLLLEELQQCISSENGKTSLATWEEWRNKFQQLGWETAVTSSGRYPFEVDFIKDEIGVDVTTSTRMVKIRERLVQSLFVSMPLFIRAKKIQIGIIITLPNSIKITERISEFFRELHPLTLKYPFVVMSCANEPSPSTDVIELTSDLDLVLVESVGYSLDEMLLFQEKPNYDFKEKLPSNKKIAREICGFANLSGGGVILIGIADNGIITGIEQEELDKIQLQLTNIINDSCSPTPQFEFHVFDTPQVPGKYIVVLQIHELEYKPCIAEDRVYIRSGPSVRPASSEDIRRLVLR